MSRWRVSWTGYFEQLFKADPPARTLDILGSTVLEADPSFSCEPPSLTEMAQVVNQLMGDKTAGICVYHDVTSTFKKTTIRMKKQNPGYGLHCHRAIITMCKLIGVQDMYAKVSGSTNLLNITRALFQGLGKQETHQQLADRKELHVVEFQDAYGSLPIVVASPKGGARSDPEPEDEIPHTKLDWNEVKASQGMTRSAWANLKRTIW
ncbi:RT05 protein, partial [Polypterus senegalus]